MPKKTIAILPEKKTSKPIVERSSHILISLGDERFALDLTAALSELDRSEAKVISIETRKPSISRKGSPRQASE